MEKRIKESAGSVMSWRTVIISNRCKLDYKMGFMVVRGEETKRVYLDEMSILIIENPAISLTGCLLESLIEKKIRVIFCDSKRSPMAELSPYHGSYDCARKLKMQIGWEDSIKGVVWAEIISDKIRKQAALLDEIGKERESALLSSYLCQIEEYDTSNREGHAAKVYFNALFGLDFKRGADNATNAALNYGYGLILSAFNREITACGYVTQFGLFHCNTFNHFNLSCDLMEPFRVLVDKVVYKKRFLDFGTKEKHELAEILSDSVCIADTTQTVLNAIRIYCQSVFTALNEKNISLISFYKQV